MTRPLFLHAGLPKTATSALQRLVLARHPQIAYTALARKGGRHRGTSPFGGLVRAVRTGEPLFHDTCELRAVLEAALARDGRPDAVCAVVSEERFTGHYGAGLAAKADLAAVLAPRASVLLVVREPGELMVSQYFQLLRRDRYGLDGPRSFDAWVRGARPGRASPERGQPARLRSARRARARASRCDPTPASPRPRPRSWPRSASTPRRPARDWRRRAGWTWRAGATPAPDRRARSRAPPCAIACSTGDRGRGVRRHRRGGGGVLRSPRPVPASTDPRPSIRLRHARDPVVQIDHTIVVTPEKPSVCEAGARTRPMRLLQ